MYQNHVTVKINNLDIAGKVVDAAVSAGSNDINNLLHSKNDGLNNI